MLLNYPVCPRICDVLHRVGHDFTPSFWYCWWYLCADRGDGNQNERFPMGTVTGSVCGGPPNQAAVDAVSEQSALVPRGRLAAARHAVAISNSKRFQRSLLCARALARAG